MTSHIGGSAAALPHDGGHIFLSYARADATYVVALAAHLEQHGIGVWFDQRVRVGDQWPDELRKRIETCVAMIVVMSRAAAESTWVLRELDWAERHDKRIFPLLLAGDRPMFGLSVTQYCDVRGGAMPPPSMVTDLRELVRASMSAASPTVWMMPPSREGTVARPELTSKVVALLLAATPGAAVGVTGVYGAGGFGKTTVAAIVSDEPAIRDRFTGGLLWADVGQDRNGPQLTALIADLCEQLAGPGRRPSFANPDQAGHHLGELLDRRGATLLVIDDVWNKEQLDPFLQGGRSATRLITTRVATVLPVGARSERVDEMSDDEARELLTRGLPPLREDLTQRLVTLTGRWALLVALVNGSLARRVRLGDPVDVAGEHLVQRLDVAGPGAPDLNDPGRRGHTVDLTIESNLSLLTAVERNRFFELGIFAEDVAIPADVITALWAATGGLSRAESESLIIQLAELCLAAEYRPQVGGADPALGAIRLHDVLRAYTRTYLGQLELRAMNAALLDAVTARLEAVPARLDATHTVDGVTRAWWTLPDDASYLWRFATYHLAETGLMAELQGLATDLRWVEERVRRHGVAEIEVDLGRLTDATSVALRRAIMREAHVLGPVEPAHSHADILASRLGGDQALAALTAEFEPRRPAGWRGRDLPRISNAWAPPDVNPAQRRVLTGHSDGVLSVAIDPSSRLVATAGVDRTVRLWDSTSGRVLTTHRGHTDRVHCVAFRPDATQLASAGHDRALRLWSHTAADGEIIHADAVFAIAYSPDGSWIATTGNDRSVRLWDAMDHSRRTTLTGHAAPVRSVAIAQDGGWLATASDDGTVRLWSESGAGMAVLSGHNGPVWSVAIEPGGAWLVSAGDDATVRIWDPASTNHRVLLGHLGPVLSVAVSPDATWLASSSNDKTVRIWDVASGTQQAVLTGHNAAVRSVAIAPNGTWLASAGSDRTVRIWDAPHRSPVPREVAQEAQAIALAGQAEAVHAMAVAPDGMWLATGSDDGTVRVWDATTGAHRRSLSGHNDWVRATAVAPNSTWFATGSHDKTVRIWDPNGDAAHVTLLDHVGPVRSVTVAPDGTWLAVASGDQVRIWDATSWQQIDTLSGHDGPVLSVAIASDGTWLASASKDKSVRIWDWPSARCRTTLVGHTDWVRSVAIAPNGAWLASVSDDHTARIWAADGSPALILSGHTEWVQALSISPDGILATAGKDATVRIWDVLGSGDVPGTNIATMRVDGPLFAVAWRPPGYSFYAAGERGIYHFVLELPVRPVPSSGLAPLRDRRPLGRTPDRPGGPAPTGSGRECEAP